MKIACHFAGCNKMATKTCSSCSNMFCIEHFDDGIAYRIPSSDNSFDIVYSDFCHECWQKASAPTEKFERMFGIGVLVALLLLWFSR